MGNNGTGPGNMNKAEAKEWQKNLAIFAIPLFSLYATQVPGALQYGGFDYTYDNLLKVLIPTPFTLGGIVLYIINGTTDFLRKWTGDNTK